MKKRYPIPEKIIFDDSSERTKPPSPARSPTPLITVSFMYPASTKVAIILKKADNERMTLPEDVVYFLATRIKSNIRELDSYY